jgi:hypothetical protein
LEVEPGGELVEVARCYACGRDKRVDEFSPDRSKASGRSSICRACDRDKSKRYYEANRERKLAKMAERNAGLREAAGARGRRSTRRRAA